MIPMLGRRSVTRRSYAAGSYDGSGDYVPGAATDTTISASVQPVGKDDVRRLPEGYRADRWRKIFTEERLNIVEQLTQTKGDELLIDGHWYSVQMADDWVPVAPLRHYEALVVRVSE